MTVRTRLLLLQLIEVLGVCAFFFFFGLGAFGLTGADEPRYAQIAREMYQRHDWVVPTLNGSPWLEKPPLLYWMAMTAYRLCGVQDWVARLPAAFCATGLVLTIFFFMRRFCPDSALDSALIAASMPAMIGFARAASTDMLLSAPFCAAMLAWWAWHESAPKLTEKTKLSKFCLTAFYVLLAFAVLAKGPVAPALALLIVAVYAGLRRDPAVIVRSLWLPGFLLFFAIALPWYVAVQMRVPEFFRVFFIEHNLERFGTNLYRHQQPFWYYAGVFVLSTLAWVVFTLPALWEAVRGAATQIRVRFLREDQEAAEAPKTEEVAAGRLQQFLLAWILVPVIFFSISRSKLPGYILPVIPAAALLTAQYLDRRQRVPRLQIMLHSLVCGGILAGAFLAPWILRREALTGQARAILILAAGFMAILVLVLVQRGGVRLLKFATLLPVILGLGFLLRPAAAAIDQALSARVVDARLRELGITDIPLAVSDKREVEYGLTFYRNQRILNYERDAMPASPFVVIAREGRESLIEARDASRQVTKVDDLPSQHLEFFLLSDAK